MRRLVAGGCVFAFGAALLFSAPVLAASQKSSAGKAPHHSPTHSAPQQKPAAKSAAKSAAKATAKSTTKVAAKGSGTGKSSRPAKSRHPAKSKLVAKKSPDAEQAQEPLAGGGDWGSVVHGPTEGRVISPEVFGNCVRFVQRNSDFGLTGRGYKWWEEAAGRFDRSHEPQPGAVMVFDRTRKMPSGHVALVREVVDSRHILIDHSNWSSGRGGRVDLAVEVADVSSGNDWSQVRVWYGPIQQIGLGIYPVQGFVLPKKPAPTQVAQVTAAGDAADALTD